MNKKFWIFGSIVFSLLGASIFFTCQTDEQHDTDDDDHGDDDQDDDADDDATVGVIGNLADSGCPIQGVMLDAGGLRIELLDGGIPGDTGTSVAVGGDGTTFVAAVMARSLCLYHFSGASGKLSAEVIDRFAIYPRLARDPAGNMHLAYGDRRNKTIKYANNVGGSWQIMTADTDGYPGLFDGFDLAIDGSGHAMLIYVDKTSDELRFISNKTGTWVKEILATAGVGWDAAIAADAVGYAHLARIDYNEDRLIYMTNQSGAWASVTVADSRASGPLDIAIDADGAVSIAYPGDDSVLLARGDGNSFSSQKIHTHPLEDEYGANFWSISLVADSQKFLHLMYQVNFRYEGDCDFKESNPATRDEPMTDSIWYATNKNHPEFKASRVTSDYKAFNGGLAADAGDKLYYAFYSDYDDAGSIKKLAAATNVGGGWAVRTLEDGHATDDLPLLELDAASRPQILYALPSPYGVLMVKDGQDWVKESLDEAIGEASTARSFVLDQNDRPHISYTKWERVYYLTKDAGAWMREMVVNQRSNGNTMDVDQTGKVNIAFQTYISPGHDRLSLETGTFGDWDYFNLDHQGMPGELPALRIDPQNTVHIAYTRNSSFLWPLLYGSLVGGVWNTETVTTTEEPRETALAFDPEGGVHIAYVDSKQHQLKYAVKVGPTWNLEAVDSIFISGYQQDLISNRFLAVSDDGAAHLGYYVYETETVKYATNVAATWTKIKIDEGIFGDIAVDETGLVHLVYNCADAICYATFPQGYTGEP